MTERDLTFTDLDENPLVVRLKRDRIELAVYDSHPELAGGELRALASALFAEYVGPHLVIRVVAARARLLAARAAHAAGARGAEAIAALDGALRALDDVTRVMTEAGAIEDPKLPPLPLAPAELPAYAPLGRPRRARRAPRAEEAGELHAWGWRRAHPAASGYVPASSISTR
jgi:hypothetical protein